MTKKIKNDRVTERIIFGTSHKTRSYTPDGLVAYPHTEPDHQDFLPSMEENDRVISWLAEFTPE